MQVNLEVFNPSLNLWNFELSSSSLACDVLKCEKLENKKPITCIKILNIQPFSLYLIGEKMSMKEKSLHIWEIYWFTQICEIITNYLMFTSLSNQTPICLGLARIYKYIYIVKSDWEWAYTLFERVKSQAKLELSSICLVHLAARYKSK